MRKAKIHFIGIGGIGMSALAEVLLTLGHQVSGSDQTASANTERLQKLGATIFIGHQYGQIPPGTTTVTYSSAIKEDNPEMQEARDRHLPILRRAEILAEIMRLKVALAVAGTHGKTTTSGALATILEECGLRPTYIIGGIVNNLGRHAKVGQGEFLVAEADESDGSFLLLNPVASIITNVDRDHMDFYHEETKLHEAFLAFANRVPFFGFCALNGHDEVLVKMREKLKRPFIYFGIEGEALTELDYAAFDLKDTPEGMQFKVRYQGQEQGLVQTKLFGRHNVLNILSAMAVAHHLGPSWAAIIQGVAKFTGMGRRLEVIKQKPHLLIIDDYAHHPTAVQIVLKTLRERYPQAALQVIFEPHRYTRTKDCWAQFLHSFNAADELFLLPIYAASERPIEGISAAMLAEDINKAHPQKCTYLPDYPALREHLLELKKLSEKSSQDYVIAVLGAGSIGRKVREIVAENF
ncbi:MAG: UDP-N-acetylmuramate--L-alanine ligase [Bacteriovoracaceae bacterium]|nr:UDP-N-acetylmuramate--L-alanine ligase [Bacteriovoracaceae bacterium]